jgi:uncharacterized membrane protein YeaQ/YmgE (transglycosylase-associated protein family)
MRATIVGALILGAVLGYLAKLVLPGRQTTPAWATIETGVMAGLIGGLIADWLGVGETRGIDWIKHGIQLVLAVIAVSWVARAYASRSGGANSGRGRAPGY